jgi:hypothetical protein
MSLAQVMETIEKCAFCGSKRSARILDIIIRHAS